jgi:hypothetical protein
MSDFNSSLPVRTQSNGDVVAFIADGSVSSQLLAIDASGRVTIKLDDGAGNAITSQVNGSQQALDVGINVAGVQVDPRDIRALTAADVVTANQGAPNTNANAWFARLTDGTNDSILLASGELTVAVTQPLPAGSNTIGKVDVNNFPNPVDTNYGAVGASTIRTASEIGNATGAADFNFGTASAQTLRVAALPGNASGLADFNNGTTGAQTLRVAANLAVGGANVSSSNPVPVTLSAVPLGTSINDFNHAVAIASGASSNHDYTVTALKTLQLNQIDASSSGKMKIEVEIETGVATGIFTSKFVQFNSTATPNMQVSLPDPISVAAGVRVRVVRTNNDNQSQDLYSTISGQES